MELTGELFCHQLLPFSTIDYPGEFSAVIFFGGCSFSCPYCHNSQLRTAPNTLSSEPVLEFLKTRIGKLSAVTFSGGEPTEYPLLSTWMRIVRSLGFKVCLHTNGWNLSEEIISLSDYVALDLKAPRQLYARVTGVRESFKQTERALNLLRQAKTPYELRTTARAPVKISDVSDIRDSFSISPDEKYILQVRASDSAQAEKLLKKGEITWIRSAF